MTLDSRGSTFTPSLPASSGWRAPALCALSNFRSCPPPLYIVSAHLGHRKYGSTVDIQPLLLPAHRSLESTTHSHSLPSSALLLLVRLQCSYLPLHIYVQHRPRPALNRCWAALSLYPPYSHDGQLLDHHQLLFLLHHLVDPHPFAPSPAR